MQKTVNGLRYILLIFSLLSAFSFQTLGIDKNFRSRFLNQEMFKGKVKSIVQEYRAVVYDEDFDLEESSYTKNIKEFDINGNILSDITYNKKGIKQIITYKYNESGLLTEITRHETSSNITYTSIYTYDSNDNILESMLTTGRDSDYYQKEEYKYDLNGLVIESISTLKYGENIVINRFTYSYDKSSKLIEERVYDSNNIFQIKNSNIYDTKGNLIRIEFVTKDGKTGISHISTYDLNNLKLSERIPAGMSDVFCKFKYDEKGNITEIAYSAPNSLDIVTSKSVRVIQYY